MRIRRSERAKRDQDIRRQKALSEGTEVTYLTCPLCGRNQPLDIKKWERKARFQVKPDYAIITTRKGGGRRIGFFRLPERDVKLADLREAYPEVFDNLRESIETLHGLMTSLSLAGTKWKA